MLSICMFVVKESLNSNLAILHENTLMFISIAFTTGQKLMKSITMLGLAAVMMILPRSGAVYQQSIIGQGI